MAKNQAPERKRLKRIFLERGYRKRKRAGEVNLDRDFLKGGVR
jgi:hypothetical protein